MPACGSSAESDEAVVYEKLSGAGRDGRSFHTRSFSVLPILLQLIRAETWFCIWLGEAIAAPPRAGPLPGARPRPSLRQLPDLLVQRTAGSFLRAAHRKSSSIHSDRRPV